MCIGIPMRVVAGGDGMALCEGRGQQERLNLMLVGDQPAGTWVLAFQGSAVRVLSDEEAAATNDALDALESVLAGGGVTDAFFADLVGREPQLPEHLREGKPGLQSDLIVGLKPDLQHDLQPALQSDRIVGLKPDLQHDLQPDLQPDQQTDQQHGGRSV